MSEATARPHAPPGDRVSDRRRSPTARRSDGLGSAERLDSIRPRDGRGGVRNVLSTSSVPTLRRSSIVSVRAGLRRASDGHISTTQGDCASSRTPHRHSTSFGHRPRREQPVRRTASSIAGRRTTSTGASDPAPARIAVTTPRPAHLRCAEAAGRGDAEQPDTASWPEVAKIPHVPSPGSSSGHSTSPRHLRHSVQGRRPSDRRAAGRAATVSSTSCLLPPNRDATALCLDQSFTWGGARPRMDGDCRPNPARLLQTRRSRSVAPSVIGRCSPSDSSCTSTPGHASRGRPGRHRGRGRALGPAAPVPPPAAPTRLLRVATNRSARRRGDPREPARWFHRRSRSGSTAKPSHRRAPRVAEHDVVLACTATVPTGHHHSCSPRPCGPPALRPRWACRRTVGCVRVVR